MSKIVLCKFCVGRANGQVHPKLLQVQQDAFFCRCVRLNNLKTWLLIAHLVYKIRKTGLLNYITGVADLTACILGLSAILHMSALAFQTIKFAGVAYLFYLAWSMWRETGSITFNSPSTTGSLWRIATKGFLINILNPKLSIFFLAFLPLFISPGTTSPTLQLLTLSSIFMGLTLLIFILYGLSANGVRRYVTHSPQIIIWMQRSFAATFAILGAKLAMTEQ